VVPSPPPRSPAVPSGDKPSLSISDLYGRVDRALRDALPGEVWVSGEVRSFNVSSRGHCYLDLVDPSGAQDMAAPVLKVVCWSGRWARVRATLDQVGIVLEAGLVVRVRGEVQLYKPRGDISFILSELDTDALLGKVAAERARLVKALVDEDLFDANRRRPVPTVALRIGLVASPGTEGYRDFLGRLEASGLAFDVRVVPTQVQGREAPTSVAAAVTSLAATDCDIVVVVRGGGSKGDLATFDTEPVARAIATSSVPVWTGIGHTGDQSVADEVANRSFITPTECGDELARRATRYWEDALDAGRRVSRLASDVATGATEHLSRARLRLATGSRMQLDLHAARVATRSGALHGGAQRQLDAHRRDLADRATGLARSASATVDLAGSTMVRRTTILLTLPERVVDAEDRQLGSWRRLLSAYDYRRQLERGYSVTRGADGTVVRSVTGLEPGTELTTRVSDGEVRSVVAAVGEIAVHDQGGTPR